MREESFIFYDDEAQRSEPQYQQFFVTYRRVYNIPEDAIDIIPMLGSPEPNLPDTIFDNDGVQIPRVLACQWERTPQGADIPVIVTWYQVRLYSSTTSTTSPAELNGSQVTKEEAEWQNGTRFFCSTGGSSGVSLGDSYPGDTDTALDRRICYLEDNTNTTKLPGMTLSVVAYKGVRLTGITLGVDDAIGEIVKHPIYGEDPDREEISIFGVSNSSGKEPSRGTKFYNDTGLDLAARVLVRYEEDPYFLPGLYMYKLTYMGAIPFTGDSATFMEIKGSRYYDTLEKKTYWSTRALFYDESNIYEESDSYPQDTDYICTSTKVQMEWLPGMHFQEARFDKYNEVAL